MLTITDKYLGENAKISLEDGFPWHGRITCVRIQELYHIFFLEYFANSPFHFENG